MEVTLLLQELNTAVAAERKEALKKELSLYINELLLHNFSALVQLLYRVDVSEQKLKTVLQQNPQQDAGNLIAELVIQRQQEKYQSRKNFPSSANETNDEERW